MTDGKLCNWIPVVLCRLVAIRDSSIPRLACATRTQDDTLELRLNIKEMRDGVSANSRVVPMKKAL